MMDRSGFVARLKVGAVLLSLWGVYQIVLGAYFIFARPSLLPEDLRASATTLSALQLAAPGLQAWLHFVFVVMGGQMAAVGFLVLGSGVSVFRGFAPAMGTLMLYLVTGLLSVVLMSGVNFALGSDFRWYLVLPSLVWLLGIILVQPYERI